MGVSVQFHREDGAGSWKTVPVVLVPRSVPAKMVPTVPVSGYGSVPGPPCLFIECKHRALQNTTVIKATEIRR